VAGDYQLTSTMYDLIEVLASRTRS